MTIVGIILAGGKGTRINSQKVNKVTLSFLEKPIIWYAVKLLQEITDKIVVVIGAFAKSVEEALKSFSISYVIQRKRLGTGHALKIGLQKAQEIVKKIDLVIVGYGDHMMFYPSKIIKDLIHVHQKEKAMISLISTTYDKPNLLAWGRIIRNGDHTVKAIIEQKDATDEERKIKETNAGFYCFDYHFLKDIIGKIKKSPVSGEYYLTELIHIAREKNKKVVAMAVPFKYVGIGINTEKELEESQKLYNKTHHVK